MPRPWTRSKNFAERVEEIRAKLAPDIPVEVWFQMLWGGLSCTSAARIKRWSCPMQPINTVNPTIYLAIELSVSTWLIAARLPGSEKPHLHRIEGGDTAALFALISSLRARVARRLDAAIGVVCCFEAGRDGFWLHRLLTAHGIANYVLEPTSILINRRARRAKTDRLDAIGMLRVLAAYLRGDRQSCSMVRVPTPEDEDAKRIHRERETLVQEKLRIENGIEALLFGRSRRAQQPTIYLLIRQRSVNEAL